VHKPNVIVTCWSVELKFLVVLAVVPPGMHHFLYNLKVNQGIGLSHPIVILFASSDYAEEGIWFIPPGWMSPIFMVQTLSEKQLSFKCKCIRTVQTNNTLFDSGVPPIVPMSLTTKRLQYFY
jgi:hypothetical protein